MRPIFFGAYETLPSWTLRRIMQDVRPARCDPAVIDDRREDHLSVNGFRKDYQKAAYMQAGRPGIMGSALMFARSVKKKSATRHKQQVARYMRNSILVLAEHFIRHHEGIR